MKGSKAVPIILGVIVVLGIVWWLASPLFIVVETNEDFPILAEEISSVAEGKFVPSAHNVAGVAKIIETDNGSKYLRFEDFETDNGPNLHIYLSTDTNAEDFIDLGEIKATKGNVNYELPEDADIESYDTVLIWCVPFRVLFSYAEIN